VAGDAACKAGGVNYLVNVFSSGSCSFMAFYLMTGNVI
jgi:hypothetical protein